MTTGLPAHGRRHRPWLQFGVVERVANGGGQGVELPGSVWKQVSRWVPVTWEAAGGAHERGAARHGLDGGEREAFVERWHRPVRRCRARRCARRDAADEVHAVVETRAVIVWLAGIRRRLPMIASPCGARRELGDRLEQELETLHATSADAVVTMWPDGARRRGPARSRGRRRRGRRGSC